MAVFRGSDYTGRFELGGPEFKNVVDDDEVGVEVDDTCHAVVEDVAEVVTRVV